MGNQEKIALDRALKEQHFKDAENAIKGEATAEDAILAFMIAMGNKMDGKE